MPTAAGLGDAFLGDRDGDSIKVRSRGLADKAQNRWRQVRVRGYEVGRRILCNSRSSNDQGDVHVLFIPAFLTRLQAVLTNVVPIVSRVYDNRVAKNPMCVELVNDPLDELVNCLESAKSLAEKVVVVGNVLFSLTGQLPDPSCTRRLCNRISMLPLYADIGLMVPLPG